MGDPDNWLGLSVDQGIIEASAHRDAELEVPPPEIASRAPHQAKYRELRRTAGRSYLELVASASDHDVAKTKGDEVQVRAARTTQAAKSTLHQAHRTKVLEFEDRCGEDIESERGVLPGDDATPPLRP